MSKAITFLLLLLSVSMSFASEEADLLGTWRLLSYNTALLSGN